MYVRPPRNYVSIEGSTTEKMKVVVQPSYADHTLVVGPRYQIKDFKLACANYLGKDISGLMICGLNDGTKTIQHLKVSQFPSSYRIKGILGKATENYFYTGRIVEKATYHFVKRKVIDKLCASMQAAHQKTMFEYVISNITYHYILNTEVW